MKRPPLVALGRRLRPRTGRGWDAVLAAVTLVLFVITWPTLFATHVVDVSVAPVVAAAVVAPLLLLRTQPFAGWWASVVVATLVGLALDASTAYDFPWHVVQLLVLVVLLFAVVVTRPRQEQLTAWSVTLALVLVFLPWDLKAGWAFGITLVSIVAVLIRWLIQSRQQLARQEEVSELERARRAVLEERGRIARDLHDVVAHSMSMVVVQAQSAPQRLGGVSPEVAQEFASIGDQARAALNEVRGMLGVLRSDGQLPESVPQPGLDQVGTLLRDTKDAGVDLHLSVAGDPTGCSEASAMVVVRVLQESLANAARHAPGSEVQVDLGYDGDEVDVLVRNPVTHPDAESTSAPTAGGTGLVGMRARVTALGGRFGAGYDGAGSFVVRAMVPKTATGRAGGGR
jgi:signal transduction histidine kinase